VKKVWMIVALAALGAVATSSFADVQNIRLSGDIRVRGYYLENANVNNDASTAFITQRTRVSVEADLEDHVLVVVTLSGESLWGGANETGVTAGAGTWSGSQINRAFDIGVTEAYVQLNEAFYSPATLKIGRQYLNYGRGLIISSYDQVYNFDAGRLVLDYYPLTIDVVGAVLANSQTYSPNPTSTGAANLLFVNARYEMTDSLLKSLEAYYGWAAQMVRRLHTAIRAICISRPCLKRHRWLLASVQTSTCPRTSMLGRKVAMSSAKTAPFLTDRAAGKMPGWPTQALRSR